VEENLVAVHARRVAARPKTVGAVVGAIALALSFLLGFGSGTASAQDLPDGPGTITIDQSPVGPTGFCLPPFLSLTHSVAQTPTTFTLTITASPSLCEPVAASAVIYKMPTDGTAWPQQLALKQNFTINGPGTTTVTFHKGCLPAQFDVLTGATPPVISPTGEWHGPLLFPFDVNSSLQFFGGNCTGGNCETYTPKNVTVTPSSVAPGGTVTVAGNGTPGTKIEILLQQPPATAVPTGVTVVVPPSGAWSAPITVPANLSPGSWQVIAKVDGCQTQTSANLTVTGAATGEGSTTSSTTSSTVAPGNTPPSQPGAVAGNSVTNPPASAAPLPEAAVAGESISKSSGSVSASGNTQAAGLAFTGSSVRLPVLVGVGLLVAGVLILLQRRRRSA
jgi:hypothetical protein